MQRLLERLCSYDDHKCKKVRGPPGDEEIILVWKLLGAEQQAHKLTVMVGQGEVHHAVACPTDVGRRPRNQQAWGRGWQGCPGAVTAVTSLWVYVLVEASLKAQPEMRMWVQVFYLGGDSSRQEGGSRERASR